MQVAPHVQVGPQVQFFHGHSDSFANFSKMSLEETDASDEARQSQLALVGNASDGWRQARADASDALDELLCATPTARKAIGTRLGGGHCYPASACRPPG